jgi:hypothetical protein
MYIGISAKTADERWRRHLDRALGARPRGALSHAIKKYGPEDFKVETLVIANDWDYLCDLERKAIAAFNTKSPNGYNLTDGGEGIHGYIHDDISRANISKAQQKRYSDPAQRQKLVGQSAAANAAMRAAKSARRIDGMTSTQHKAHLKRLARAEKNVAKGAKLQAERVEKEKFLNGHKRMPASQQRKDKIRVAQLAAWADPERKKKRIESVMTFHPQIEFVCQRCNVIFAVPVWKSKRNPKFCSWKCCFPNSENK